MTTIKLIVNSVSKSERESIIAALHGQSIFNGGGLSPLNKISPSHPPKPATVAVPEETEKKARDVNEKTALLKKKSATELGELATSINTIARDAHMEANLEMEIVPQGLRVLIKDDQNRNMFERAARRLCRSLKRCWWSSRQCSTRSIIKLLLPGIPMRWPTKTISTTTGTFRVTARFRLVGCWKRPECRKIK
ncbi:MbhA protein [Escherichia coli H454]|nr:MbhA protein [Escherichia coli H454]